MLDHQDNYFTLFGLPVAFDIPLEKLEETYLKLQKEFHPDKFASSVVVERSLANQRTAEINLAYDTLKNPLHRARYLLELHNDYEVDTEHTINNSDFLMEQMQWREDVEEAQESSSELNSLQDRVIKELNQLYTDYNNLHKQLQPGDNADQLVNLLHRMQYFVRLQQEILTKLP